MRWSEQRACLGRSRVRRTPIHETSTFSTRIFGTGYARLGIKLNPFGKHKFGSLARVAPPALRLRLQFGGEECGYSGSLFLPERAVQSVVPSSLIPKGNLTSHKQSRRGGRRAGLRADSGHCDSRLRQRKARKRADDIEISLARRNGQARTDGGD